jgi:hypothetical protein
LTLATYYWFKETPLYSQAVILFTDDKTLSDLPWTTILRGLMAILAALMVSDVPYPAVPSIGFSSIRRILGTLVVAGCVALLVFRHEEFIFPALLAYVLYGVVKWAVLGFVGRAATPGEIFWDERGERAAREERRAAARQTPSGMPRIPVADAAKPVDEEDDDTLPTPQETRPPRRKRRRRGHRGPRPSGGSQPPGPTLPDSPTGPTE